jgi:hypothetical protein
MNAHPKLSVETATQLAVFLANRPGALARVCHALANAGVNIYALATSDTVDHTVVRMVVSDPTKALMLLGEAGVLALETDVLTIETASEPGVLGKIAERLAEAKVNIEYAYRAAGREAEKGLIILRLSDVEKSATCARGALGKSLGPPGRSWTNLYYRAVRRNPPEFFDLFVGNCDATGGPIFPAMKRANPAASVLNSVDHDVKTRRNSVCSRTLVVFIRWIRNVQCAMETALRISAIDLVDPFRRFHVAFFLLRA